MRTPQTLTVLMSLATALVAQQPDDALLFSPKKTEQTRSGTGGSSILSQLGARSVAVVRPEGPECDHSAEKFAPALGYQTLAGDEDGDGDVHTDQLMVGIDAVMVKPYKAYAGQQQGEWQPWTGPVDMLDVYISPIEDVGTNVSGAPGLRRGDCGRFVRTPAGNGQVEHFIRAEHIISAFGIFDSTTQQAIDAKDLQLDAITVTFEGHIFLSFEEDRNLRLQVGGGVASFLLGDGGVAWLPPSAWMPDARGNVLNVQPRRGRIAFSEPQVDAMVTNAQVADYTGNCPVTIGDTDGLTRDRVGGMVQVFWNGTAFNIPNLLFCGEATSGAGVLTTRAGGAIAQMNGCQLAQACGSSTNGEQTGLQDTGSVGSLDGLSSLDREPCRFVLGSPTPTGLGGAIEVHVGHNLPAAQVFLMLGIGNLPVSPSIDFHPWNPNLQCFPEIYPAVVGTGLWLPTPAHAYGDRAGVLGPVVAPFIGSGILFQAAAITANGVELSTPITLH